MSKRDTKDCHYKGGYHYYRTDQDNDTPLNRKTYLPVTSSGENIIYTFVPDYNSLEWQGTAITCGMNADPRNKGDNCKKGKTFTGMQTRLSGDDDYGLPVHREGDKNKFCGPSSGENCVSGKKLLCGKLKTNCLYSDFLPNQTLLSSTKYDRNIRYGQPNARGTVQCSVPKNAITNKETARTVYKKSMNNDMHPHLANELLYNWCNTIKMDNDTCEDWKNDYLSKFTSLFSNSDSKNTINKPTLRKAEHSFIDVSNDVYVSTSYPTLSWDLVQNIKDSLSLRDYIFGSPERKHQQIVAIETEQRSIYEPSFLNIKNDTTISAENIQNLDEFSASWYIYPHIDDFDFYKLKKNTENHLNGIARLTTTSSDVWFMGLFTQEEQPDLNNFALQVQGTTKVKKDQGSPGQANIPLWPKENNSRQFYCIGDIKKNRKELPSGSQCFENDDNSSQVNYIFTIKKNEIEVPVTLNNDLPMTIEPAIYSVDYFTGFLKNRDEYYNNVLSRYVKDQPVFTRVMNQPILIGLKVTINGADFLKDNDMDYKKIKAFVEMNKNNQVPKNVYDTVMKLWVQQYSTNLGEQRIGSNQTLPSFNNKSLASANVEKLKPGYYSRNRDYYFNTQIGLEYCTKGGNLKDECRNALKKVCLEDPIQLNDKIKGFSNLSGSSKGKTIQENKHFIESNACDYLFRNMPETGYTDFNKNFIKPNCQYIFKQFYDNCLGENSEECLYWKSKLLNGGACSCFLGDEEMSRYLKTLVGDENYMTIANKIGNIDGSCYPSCKKYINNNQHLTQKGNYINSISKCSENNCILAQNISDVNIQGTDSNFNVKALLDCFNKSKPSDDDDGKKPDDDDGKKPKSKTNWARLFLIITILTGLFLLAYTLLLKKSG